MLIVQASKNVPLPVSLMHSKRCLRHQTHKYCTARFSQFSKPLQRCGSVMQKALQYIVGSLQLWQQLFLILSSPGLDMGHYSGLLSWNTAPLTHFQTAPPSTKLRNYRMMAKIISTSFTKCIDHILLCVLYICFHVGHLFDWHICINVFEALKLNLQWLQSVK